MIRLLEYRVLIASQWAGTGVAIQRTILKRTGEKCSTGSVYASLHRLKRKQYVTSWKEKKTPVRGGRAKTLYGITPKGDRALREINENIQKLGLRK